MIEQIGDEVLELRVLSDVVSTMSICYILQTRLV